MPLRTSLLAFCFFFFSSRRRHTRCALVTGVQTCALPIYSALWTIPKERMKMHVEHRVPLSHSAVELLRATAANSNRPPDAYVFAGQKRGCPLSNVSMTAVLKRMRLGHLTVHGMRSRPEERRVVKEGVGRCSSRWTPYL